MAKSKLSQSDHPKQETVQPVIPQPGYKIVRETDESGKRSYYHPLGKEVETVTESLHDTLCDILARFDDMVGTMNDDAYDAIGFLLGPFVRDARHRLWEVFEIASRSIGEIKVDVVCHGNDTYRGGRIVGTFIEPPKVEAGKEVPHDTNKENTQGPAFILASTGMDLSKDKPSMIDLVDELKMAIQPQIDVMYECLYAAREAGNLKCAVNSMVAMLNSLSVQLDNLTEAFLEARRRHKHAEAAREEESS